MAARDDARASSFRREIIQQPEHVDRRGESRRRRHLTLIAVQLLRFIGRPVIDDAGDAGDQEVFAQQQGSEFIGLLSLDEVGKHLAFVDQIGQTPGTVFLSKFGSGCLPLLLE